MNYDVNNTAAIVFAGILSLVITALFCKSLAKTLNLVDPENRTIKKETIWLLLVPGLNLILNFFVVTGMSDSISKELESRNFELEEKPAYNQGIGFAIISAVMAVLSFVPIPANLAIVAFVLALVQVISFIQYWSKIRWYRSILQEDEGNEDRSTEE